MLDFIQLGESGIFNLADQCVTAGAAVVLIQTFRGVPMRTVVTSRLASRALER